MGVPKQNQQECVEVTVVTGRKSLTVTVSQRQFRIGRAPDCEVQINDPKVSRMHVMVEVDEFNRIWVTDESSIGTKIDGVRIDRQKRTQLKPTDVLQVNTAELWLTSFFEPAGASEPSHASVRLVDFEPAPTLAPPPLPPRAPDVPVAPPPLPPTASMPHGAAAVARDYDQAQLKANEAFYQKARSTLYESQTQAEEILRKAREESASILALVRQQADAEKQNQMLESQRLAQDHLKWLQTNREFEIQKAREEGLAHLAKAEKEVDLKLENARNQMLEYQSQTQKWLADAKAQAKAHHDEQVMKVEMARAALLVEQKKLDDRALQVNHEAQSFLASAQKECVRLKVEATQAIEKRLAQANFEAQQILDRAREVQAQALEKANAPSREEQLRAEFTEQLATEKKKYAEMENLYDEELRSFQERLKRMEGQGPTQDRESDQFEAERRQLQAQTQQWREDQNRWEQERNQQQAELQLQKSKLQSELRELGDKHAEARKAFAQATLDLRISQEELQSARGLAGNPLAAPTLVAAQPQAVPSTAIEAPVPAQTQAPVPGPGLSSSLPPIPSQILPLTALPPALSEVKLVPPPSHVRARNSVDEPASTRPASAQDSPSTAPSPSALPAENLANPKASRALTRLWMILVLLVVAAAAWTFYQNPIEEELATKLAPVPVPAKIPKVKFDPPLQKDAAATTTESVLYTRHFAEFFLDPAQASQWTRFEQEKLSAVNVTDEQLTRAIQIETNLIRSLAHLRESLVPEHQAEQMKEMHELEKNAHLDLRTMMGPAKAEAFHQAEAAFFNQSQ